MSLLSNFVVPSWLGPLAILGAFAALGTAIEVQTVRLSHAQAETEAIKREKAEIVANMAQKARIAESEARAQEQDQANQQQENLNEQLAQAQVARADSDRAGAALVGLLNRARAATSCRAVPVDTAASASGSTAATTADLPADVLSRLGEAARQLAATADQRGNAGTLSNQDYDALRSAKP